MTKANAPHPIGPSAQVVLARILSGVRWCTVKDGIVEWEEGEEAGCHWCGPDTFFAQDHKHLGVLDA